MPNIKNYKQDTTTLQNRYNKFSISRTVETTRDSLFELEVPAEFSELDLQNTVELNLYTLNDNQLIYSAAIPNSLGNAITTDKLLYKDGSSRTLLYIDFRKLIDFAIPTGTYSITLNFFKNEIGSYDDKVLEVVKISPSREEIELKLKDDKNNAQINKLKTFATPSIPARWIEQTVAQIFDQPGSQNLGVPTVSSSLSNQVLLQQLPVQTSQDIIRAGFNEASGSKPGVDDVRQTILNSSYTTVLLKVRNDVTRGTGSFTSTILQKYVVDAIQNECNKVYLDSVQTPEKYRFKIPAVPPVQT